jgi:phosphoglycolate phosphatase
VAGSELNGTRIKKSEVIRYALDKAGVEESSSSVMVGDRMHDILGANEIGIDSIGVLYGYGDYEELNSSGASMIVESVEDLQKALIG